MKRTRRNPDDSLRTLERMAQQDPSLRPAVHAERYRRGLPLMPDKVLTRPDIGSVDRDVTRREAYHLTPDRGVEVFYSNLCGRCRHEWGHHTDAESLEDEKVGTDEPCMTPGCGCHDFMPSGHFIPLHRHDMVTGSAWYPQSFGQAAISRERGETFQDAVQRQLRTYFDNFRRTGEVSVWA